MVRTKRGMVRRKRKRVWQGPYAPLIAVFAAILLLALTAEYFIITSIHQNDAVSAAEDAEVPTGTPASTQMASVPTPTETVSPVQTTPPSEQTPAPTETQAATPIPDDDTPSAPPVTQGKTYTEEDSGEEVESIQQMLVDLGFDPGKPDGIYGPKLVETIKNFQMYAGLTADSIAGPKTISTLVDKWVDAMTELEYDDQPLRGIKIGIDAGHQRNANSDTEPNAPGSSTMKKKVSSGTCGRFTGVPEYVINLQVALRLQKELEALGADVVMTREEHGVDISNTERATMMNKADVDCWLRIHANGSTDASASGMFILVPKQGTMDTDDSSIAEKSRALAEVLVETTQEETGASLARSGGISVRDDQTGFCWSSVPVCNIEMGHMTNEREDHLLVTEAYQIKIVDGLADGFVEYFDGVD